MQLLVEIGARGKEVAGCVGNEWSVVEQLFEREGTNDGRVTVPCTDVLAQSARPAPQRVARRPKNHDFAEKGVDFSLNLHLF